MPRVPDDITRYTPPPVGELRRRLRPLARWFDPQFSGLGNVDAAVPSLYVGNHTIYGIIDSPLIFAGLYERTGVFVRSLGDHYHFDIPGWGDSLLKYGAVPGTPENCAALMQSGAHVLALEDCGGRVVDRVLFTVR